MSYVFFCLLFFPKERPSNQYKSVHAYRSDLSERKVKEDFYKWLLDIEKENKECVILNSRLI